MSINIQSLIKNVKKIRLHLFRFSLLYILLLQTILNAQIQDFQVNENAGPQGEDQRHPSISVDSDGNFVIAWVDDRNGDPDIYAQRYANDGRLLGNNFKVND